jgi:hypothetical protein
MPVKKFRLERDIVIGLPVAAVFIGHIANYETVARLNRRMCSRRCICTLVKP